MTLDELIANFDADAAGGQMMAWAREWFPIPRSLTGSGIRQQFDAMGRVLPLRRHEVPSGTQVFDWQVPNEWNLRDAWIKGPDGRKVVDVAEHPLHILGYSTPVHMTMPLSRLREHLYTAQEQPDLIPYRTSYYTERWGFCLSEVALSALVDGDYEVYIDADLGPGALSYAECVIPGKTDEEIFFSAHACHPGLANDNLSGLAVATWLAQTLAQAALHHTVRFVFAPGTIGAITWLARNQANVARIRAGLVLACLGDRGKITYKMARDEEAVVNHAMDWVLQEAGADYEQRAFVPYGYDERQYCSPGFNLPIGCLMRTPPGEYPEYHTSADDLDLLDAAALADSALKLLQFVRVVDQNRTLTNQSPFCEPQLGKRGLYGSLGGTSKSAELAMLWVLNQSDGRNSLLDIAWRSWTPWADLVTAAARLEAVGLLREGVGDVSEQSAGKRARAESVPEEAEGAVSQADFWDEFLEDGGDKRKPGEPPQYDAD